MSPSPSPLLCGIALMLAVIQPSHADLEWKPLSLAKRGKFIELQPGNFFRTSSIEKISGDINLVGSRVAILPDTRVASRSFPLSLDGIKELKNSVITARIGEFGRSEDKADDIEFFLNVGIKVNDHPMDLLLINGKDSLESWDEIEKKIKTAVEGFDRLLTLASEDKQTAPSDGDRRETGSLDASSKPVSAIGSIDLSDELMKATKSVAGNGNAGGPRNGASAEGYGIFTSSEVDARKTLAALYHAIRSRVGSKEIGGGHEGEAGDDTLVSAHWIYQDQGVGGAIRIRLIQTGADRWTIVAFLHEA